MDEIIDVLDEDGNLTNKTISKDKAHKNGTWHCSVHILIINNDKTKTIFQKRCPNKKLYPNTWDIAVGGHISTKEEPLNAALREMQEELGLYYKDFDLKELELVKETLQYDDIYSNEFIYTYLIYDDVDLNDIILQKEEVSEVKWFTKEEMNHLIKNEKVIPHTRAYEILNELLK